MNPDAVSPPMNLDATALMLLQVIVTQAPHIRHKFSMHSKAFYIESRARNLSGGLQALPGFFQSVRPSIGRFLINVDTTTAAFYKKGWLLNLALEYLGVREARDVVRATKENRAKWSSLRTFLRGLNVMIVPQATNFNSEPPRNDSYRVFRITDIVADAGNITFDGPDGPTTIKNYWQNTHNTGIRYPDLFGISIGRDTIFPAEKCWVLPGQRYTRKLSPDAMNTFLTVSKSKPMDRIRDIEKAVNGPDLDYAASSWMREAGITVNPQALHIDGRQLNPPSIEYASNTQLLTSLAHKAVSDGKWNVVKKKFLMPREINAMGVIVFDAQAQEADVVNFVQKLYTNMQALAAKATVNRLPVVNGVAPRPDMMIVILPAQAAPIRQAVKYWGDVSNGISTQCVRRGKYDVQRGNSLDQYCNNVALKINAKLGGMNCTFRDSNVDTALRYAMVVGCDISHPAPGVKNRPSIASLVASIDERCVRYSAHVRCQDPRQEVIADLRGMLLDAIDSFKKRFNNHVPVKIIIYRDGVSEGEYARVISNEINQVEDAENIGSEALNAIEPRPPYKPQIVFVVVGKRHHVRFFPTGQSPADSSGNCRAGLVVDREIVHSRFLSFYLQSHGGIIGTSRPSNYVVLRNDPNWTPDHLQGVSFALCHVYAPATRSVSIPAPVYCELLL
ncbi:Piwi-domain-containing protein [Cytidiella melzeri]|nr:Piwi-domain-containing protein [Cytidiella melzeri]